MGVLDGPGSSGAPAADHAGGQAGEPAGHDADQGRHPADEPGANPTAALRACAGPRRRGEALEQAIFDAVIGQLCCVGYAGFTMEGVAAAAHTGKAALYRRWPGKEDLVVATLQAALPSSVDVPDTGSVRDDILELLLRMTKVINSGSGAAIQTLLGEVDRDHAFVRAVHERVIEPRRRMMLEVLQRGVDRGEVRPGAVNKLVAETGPALLLHHFTIDGPPVSESMARAIVDDVVLPLLRP